MPTPDQDQRLNEALAQFISAEENGHPFDPEVFVRDHPDIASELREFLDNREQLAPSRVDLGATLAGSVSVLVPPGVPSERFGDYRLLGELARGGMGVVYKARQLSADRDVALKMILNTQPSSSARRRFRIEAEAAASLDHPNIVPIYDVGEIDGQPYFTMKLVEGGSLASRRDEIGLLDRRLARSERRARQQRIAALMAAVARAVHHAHQRGVLHRDLKPGNILLQDGEPGAPVTPLVTDFGLAKRAAQDAHVTQSQTIIGTATYMAPEQAMPGKVGVTTVSDLYSLGSILYELLTGRPPFVAESFFDTLQLVVQEPPVPPRVRNPDVAADLELICLKCLEKEPGRRYESALALALDLERYRAGEVISLRRPGVAERAWRWARRNWLAALLLTTVAGLLLLGTVGALAALWHINAARGVAESKADEALNKAAEAEQARTLTAKALEAREKALAENQRLLVAGFVANGTRALDSGDMFTALVWYAEALRRDAGDPEREEAHRMRLAGVLHRCPRLIRAWFENDPGGALSADGQRVAIPRKDGVRVFRLTGDDAAALRLKHNREVKKCIFSPDGKRLLTVAADGAARVWDVEASSPAPLTLWHPKEVHFAAFSPDGSRIVTAGAEHAAIVWRTDTGKQVAGPFRHGTPILFASFSRDGKHLVTCGGDPMLAEARKGEVHVWDLANEKAGKALGFNPVVVVHGAFLTPDGKYVLGLGGRNVARLWDSTTGREVSSVPGVRMDCEASVSPDLARVLKLEGTSVRAYTLGTGQPATPPLVHGADAYYAAFSPDGRRIVTGARDRTVRVWDATTGLPLTPPLWQGRAVEWTAFSSDNQLLVTATADHIVRVWDFTLRESVQPLARLASVSSTAISPDSTRTATMERDGSLRVRDAATGKETGVACKLTKPILHFAFAPDGERLLTACETTARVWNVRSGKALTREFPHAERVQQVSFTPDGGRVVVRTEGRLQVLNAATGELELDQALASPADWRGQALTPDGSGAVGIRQGNVVEVRGLVGGELRAGPFRHVALVNQAALSPDGTRLAVATTDGNACLWDVAGGRPAAAPLRHGTPLRLVVFSGDGRKLATVAEDQSIRIWDVATGLALSPLLTHAAPLAHVSLSLDGRRLVLYEPGGAGELRDLTPDARPVDDLLRLAELLSGQTFDPASGGFEPSELPALQKAWPLMRAAYPQEFRRFTH